MRIRSLTCGLAAAAMVSLPLAGGPAVAVGPGAAPQAAPAPRVLTYDASGAAEFRSAVDRGAAAWNESVDSVELRPAASGQRADIRVLADNGWPRAIPGSLGNGTVYIGRQAVEQGYHTVRISAHELGHILGLPDRKPGPCSSLMSGASPGPGCTNVHPDASERAEVEDNFSGAARTAPAAGALAGAALD